MEPCGFPSIVGLFVLSSYSYRPLRILEPCARYMNPTITILWSAVECVPEYKTVFFSLPVCVSCMHWEMLGLQRKCSQIFVSHSAY